MSFKTDIEMAYLIGYDDATARRKPDSRRALVLDSSNCSNSERTTIVDETERIDTCCYSDPHGGEFYHIHVMECSECGHTYEHVNGDYEFCPHCGRRIVREDQ